MALIGNLRAAWWATRAIPRARRAGAGTLASAALPGVPTLPSQAVRGVNAALYLFRVSCLVRARVLQAWYLAHGEARDLVIGVTAPSRGFTAHAWLDGDPPCHSEGFQELVRQPAER
jgi:hypothetical protein